jgi:delta(3,5)-delta(2,4)-dienoyl-CoA isomerase
MDLATLGGGLLEEAPPACPARARLGFQSFLLALQDAMTACERCRCPVLAAIHGACVGAGVDLATACDIRFASACASLCVKEVDLGITADMGTLARLPGIVGDGVARELALTARAVPAAEALQLRLVSAVFADREALLEGAAAAARAIAAKSPLAVAGTKAVLLRQRGRSVEEGLEHVRLWNAAALPGSSDLREAFAARAERRPPRFSKL